MSEITDGAVTTTEAGVQTDRPNPEEIPTDGAGNAAPTGISTDPAKLKSIVAAIASRIDSSEADHLTNQECREAAIASGAVPTDMAPNHLGRVLKSIADRGFLTPEMKGDARMGYRVSESGRQLIAEEEADVTPTLVRTDREIAFDYLGTLSTRITFVCEAIRRLLHQTDQVIDKANELANQTDLPPITPESDHPLVQAKQRFEEQLVEREMELVVIDRVRELVAGQWTAEEQ